MRDGRLSAFATNGAGFIPHPSVCIPHQGVTQLAAHPVEDGALEQEVLHLQRLLGDDLVDQVVERGAMARHELSDKGRGVGLPA